MLDRFPPQFEINWGHLQAQGLVFAFLGQHPGSTLCYDSSLYSNHGTLTNMDPATDWVDGHHGMALDLDGSNDYVILPAPIVHGLSKWSLCAWAYPRNLGNNPYIIGAQGASGLFSWYSFLRTDVAGTLDNNFGDGTSSNSLSTAGSVASLNSWNCIAYANDGSTCRRFLNGIDAGSPLSHSVGAISLSYNLFIGNLNLTGSPQASRYFNGLLADIRLYSRAFSDSEIWDLYSNPTGLVLPRRRVWPGVGGGPVVVTPAAATAVAITTAPSVVLGSLALSPAAAAAIASTTAPTVVLGSVSVTPAAASAVASTTSPTVVLGSVTVVPSAAAAVASTTAPTVLLGSVVVVPAAASAVAGAAGPTVVLGSVSVVPAAAWAVATGTDPTVVISGGGSLITPAAATAVASTVAPTVVLGSIVLVPSPATAVARGVDPVVVVGTPSAPVQLVVGESLIGDRLVVGESLIPTREIISPSLIGS